MSPAAERPPVGVTRVAKTPTLSERTLRNGLRVMAVRRPGVPMVEFRLRLPFAASGKAISTQPARAALMVETMLSGTASSSAIEIAERLQRVGGSLSAGADADWLVLSGSSLAAGLPELLAIAAEVLTEAAFPAHEVLGERDRLAQDLVIARTQPGTLASAALARRIFPGHPYAAELAHVEDVLAVTPAQLRTLHSSRVRPDGGLLVLVGDVAPAKTLDRVEAALAGWSSSGTKVKDIAPVPALETGPLTLVNRPGAVQTNIRLAGPAVRRETPEYPALALAHIIFGGYFSSRLVANVREDKGYTYSPRSGIEHARAGSSFTVTVDVATGVTAPALVETGYELGRIATTAVDVEELDDARRYAIGVLALQSATQAGLASTLSVLLAAGLGPEWLREYPQRLAKVDVDAVLAAAQQFLAPGRLVSVLLGDAALVEGPLGALGPVVVESAEGL